MYVLNMVLFYSLTTLISNSCSSIVYINWNKFPYTGPVTLNYYSLIPNSCLICCIATCRTLYNWDQIYFQGKDCYCLAPVYEKVDQVSGTVTTNSSIWTPTQDVTTCSEKGYTLFLDQQYCLKYFSTNKTWYNAESTCGQDSGHLVSVYTQQDLTNLRSLYTNDQSVYIGGHRTLNGTELAWITGGTVNKFWKPGQPSNRGGNENCVEVLTTGLFNDEECISSLAFICQLLIKW